MCLIGGAPGELSIHGVYKLVGQEVKVKEELGKLVELKMCKKC